MSAIPVTQLRFHWDYDLGPRTEQRGRVRIDRAEVFVAGPQRNRRDTLYYGQIRYGLLYLRELPPPGESGWSQDDPGLRWRQVWEDIVAGESPDQARIGVMTSGAEQIRRAVRDMASRRQCSVQLIVGTRYRFWVDYWIFATQGFEGQAWDPNRERMTRADSRYPFQHRIDGRPWLPPLPLRPADWAGWQSVTIPRPSAAREGEPTPTPRVDLTCRRYALVRRLQDETSNLLGKINALEDHFANMGRDRVLLSRMRNLIGECIDADHNLWPGRSQAESGRHFARLSDSFSQIQSIAAFHLYENPQSQRLIRNANFHARRIWHTIRDSQFVSDINEREIAQAYSMDATVEAGQNSDQVRDILARAQIALVNTPSVRTRRQVSVSARRRGPALAIHSEGRIVNVVELSAPWTWENRYYAQILQPFLERADQVGGADANAVRRLPQDFDFSPLFAARQNITFIANSISMRHTLGTHQNIVYWTHRVLREQGYVLGGADEVRTRMMTGGDVEDFARTIGGATGILLTGGLTVLWKGYVARNRWREALRTRTRRDYANASQATIDGLGDAFSLYTNIANAHYGFETTWAARASTAGNVFSVVADALEAGIFFYDEFIARDDSGQYEEDYLDRQMAYNTVIFAGRAACAVGSGLMCSGAGLPLGIVVKAAGLTVANVAELIREIDRLGEWEEHNIRDIWNLMNRSPRLRAYYEQLRSEYNLPLPWDDVDSEINAISYWPHLDDARRARVRTAAREYRRQGQTGNWRLSG